MSTPNNQTATVNVNASTTPARRGRGRPRKDQQMQTASQTVQATTAVEVPKIVFDQTVEELYGDDFETRVPSTYKEIRSTIFESTRNLAKNYIPRMYTVLKEAGFSPVEARDKIQSDTSNIWKLRTILAFLPDEAKDVHKAEAGKKGGEATAERQIPKSEEKEVIEAVHKAAEKIPSELAIESDKIVCEIDLNKWLSRILNALERAQKTGSMFVKFEFDTSGHLLWVEDVLPKAVSAA